VTTQPKPYGAPRIDEIGGRTALVTTGALGIGRGVVEREAGPSMSSARVSDGPSAFAQGAAVEGNVVRLLEER
jgi:hypothetical protein